MAWNKASANLGGHAISTPPARYSPLTPQFKPDNYLSALKQQGAFLMFQLNKESFTYHLLDAISSMSKAHKANPESHTEEYGTTNKAAGKHLLGEWRER